ncbi:unnamed protein product [Periconia digitata]|uniref:Methyltransferase type 11 domain-containing protein n=1 Tax=Periconia digitata TaxID=1303443 RepID=A0A9W4UEE1_9PLEO|nr:unnamed protein product [Periconia digitata]
MASDLVSSADSWSQSAHSLLQTAFQGPTIILNEVLLDKINEISPFGAANAILDNGCGVGQVLGRLIEKYGQNIPSGARLVAADLSEGMIEVVQQRKEKEVAKGNNLWQRVEVKMWDAESLYGVPDGSFSHVSAGLLFLMLANPQCALQESRRVLRDHGILALSSFRQVEWMDFIENHLGLVKPGTTLGSIPLSWASTNSTIQELEDAGFKNVSAEEVQVWYEFDDAELMTRFNMTNIPSVKAATAGMTDDEVEKAVQLMILELGRRFPDGKGRLGGIALVAFGTK